MSTRTAQLYLEAEAASVPPLKLVRMVNAGAIEALRQSLTLLDGSDRAAFVRRVNKAQRLVAELHTSLDFEQGDAIARPLDRLYDWMQRTLTDDCLKGERRGIEAVIAVLGKLQEGWDAIRDERELSSKS